MQDPLAKSVCEGDCEEISKLLKDPNVNLERVTRGMKPIHCAASNRNPKVLELLLLDPRVDVNSRADYEMTPLCFAVISKHIENVKLLLAHPDIDVNLTDFDGHSPLYFASLTPNQNCSVFRSIFNDARIDFEKRDIFGNNVLNYAREYENNDVASALLRKMKGLRPK
jgi:ankyrin repeat protein